MEKSIRYDKNIWQLKIIAAIVGLLIGCKSDPKLDPDPGLQITGASAITSPPGGCTVGCQSCRSSRCLLSRAAPGRTDTLSRSMGK